ncbi:MAG: response regulator transcription factor [Pleurocapsa sp. MO_192.B19]|nr:response regulator transcription factor [Pleurocapsa sp. MO_192.B19]
MTTVIIVDDQISIREFLKINLANEVDIQVVGLADNGQAAIAQIGEHQPDIVLMDIEMPGQLDGIAATQIITQRFPDTRVLLFTSQDNRQQLELALKAGARGYVLKNTSIKDIAQIIHLTEKGFFQIGPILGNWDSLKSNNSISETKYTPSKVAAIVPQDSECPTQLTNVSEMNHVLSNLTSGLFQLQQTIKSQENIIINLTDQYSQVQQEIRTKLRTDQGNNGIFNAINIIKYKPRIAFKNSTQKRQHILFIISFLLGVFTVLVLMFLIMTLSAAL